MVTSKLGYASVWKAVAAERNVRLGQIIIVDDETAMAFGSILEIRRPTTLYCICQVLAVGRGEDPLQIGRSTFCAAPQFLIARIEEGLIHGGRPHPK